MLVGLSSLAKACARLKENQFYFFRRCDFEVLDGKSSPALADALRVVPDQRDELARMDELLTCLKYKRVLFVDEQEGSYRLRYSRKNDLVVYWCHIREPFGPPVGQNLRWKLASDLTPRLFDSLEQSAPDLSERVFEGIKRCDHCYERCLVRATIAWPRRPGETVEVCNESAWNRIQAGPPGFADVRAVLQTIQTLT